MGHRIVLLSVVAAVVLLVCGCVSVARNVRSAEEVKGKKILSGRFVFYENDARVSYGQASLLNKNFEIQFNKQGDTKVYRFRPDKDGYVYIAVTEGQYNIGSVRHHTRNGFAIFKLDPLPAIVVGPNDSFVNFGTLGIRFSQSAGSAVSEALIGFGKVYLRVNHVDDWDVTRPKISSETQQCPGPIVNKDVVFLRRQ